MSYLAAVLNTIIIILVAVALYFPNWFSITSGNNGVNIQAYNGLTKIKGCVQMNIIPPTPTIAPTKLDFCVDMDYSGIINLLQSYPAVQQAYTSINIAGLDFQKNSDAGLTVLILGIIALIILFLLLGLAIKRAKQWPYVRLDDYYRFIGFFVTFLINLSTILYIAIIGAPQSNSINLGTINVNIIVKVGFCFILFIVAGILSLIVSIIECYYHYKYRSNSKVNNQYQQMETNYY